VKERVWNHKANTNIGQNFLIDKNIVQTICEASNITSMDSILEIGPGKGILTTALIQSQAKKVYAIELDERLKDILLPLEENNEKLQIFWKDALKFNYRDIEHLRPYPNKLIANIPYHITTPLIWKLLEDAAPMGLNFMILMIQKEVAERLAASANSKDRCPLGITLEKMGQVCILKRVSPNVFRPKPKVDSAIIKIELIEQDFLTQNPTWKKLLKAAFHKRRKTLLNNLVSSNLLTKETASAMIEELGMKPTVRAEELSIQQWTSLHERARRYYP